MSKKHILIIVLAVLVIALIIVIFIMVTTNNKNEPDNSNLNKINTPIAITSPTPLPSFSTNEDALAYVVERIHDEEYKTVVDFYNNGGYSSMYEVDDDFNFIVDPVIDQINNLALYAFCVQTNIEKSYYLRDEQIEYIDPDYNGVLAEDVKAFCLKYADENDGFYEINEAKLMIEDNRTKPNIGMTKIDVWNSLWGYPDDINTTETAYGTSEQYIYRSDYGSDKYVYLENGIVTSVSY